MFINSIDKDSLANFQYLGPEVYYFDSACQTLRPMEVINSEIEYYTQYNACGHRVKYRWGERVDEKVHKTREDLLKYVGKSSKNYAVAFTLNTTFGINQILHQIKQAQFNRIITSEIEHNSVFLPSIVWAKGNNKPRLVLKREDDGSLDFDSVRFDQDIVIVNTTSNIDGRKLANIRELSKSVAGSGSILLLDAAQTLGHDCTQLKDIDFDAVFGSGHKMYAPSIGFIIIKKSLLSKLTYSFIGGGTVENVSLDTFKIIDDNEPHARLEAGLQNFSGIIGLGEALRWINSFKYENLDAVSYEKKLCIYLNKELKILPNITILNSEPASVVSLFSEKIDSHKLAMYLGSQNIMCRSGYFCCHYYLDKVKKSPPLLRISLGLHNTVEQIDFLMDKLRLLTK